MGVQTPNVTKQIIWHQKFMPVKYVDPKTGEFLPDALENTGAPSAYGINTPEKLVETSLSSDTNINHKDIFFSGTFGSKIQNKASSKKATEESKIARKSASVSTPEEVKDGGKITSKLSKSKKITKNKSK